MNLGNTTLNISYESQQEALLSILNAVDRNSWKENHSWDPEVPLSSWKGIKLDGSTVTELCLNSNELKGRYTRLIFNFQSI
jgi:hypothetical protein